MKTILKILISTLLITNFHNCVIPMDKKYRLYLNNNAEHSIGCYFALGDKYGTAYPDTLLPETKQYIIEEISPGDRYILDSGLEWEEVYSKLPKDTMSVFIFHTDTLKNETWNSIRDNYKILKRYDLSLEDLQNNDWTISYP